MKKIWIFACMLVCLFACQDEEGSSLQPQKRKDIVLSRSEEWMTNENLDFSFRFFKQINQTEKEEANWMVSPFSASLALGMIANGAEGNTLTEMKETLGFGSVSLEEMNAYLQKMTKELLQLDNTTSMELANSIWIREGFDVYDSFIRVNKNMYQAKVSNLDFTDPHSIKRINQWCSDHTHGCIPEVIKQIPNDACMYLLNALYFKGLWKEKFQESQTKRDLFIAENGSQSSVNMMNQRESFLYSYDDIFCMAQFPYGNEAFSMVVILPDEGQSLDDVLDKLTPAYWDELNQHAVSQLLDVKFPRFELKYKKDLRDDMAALGMKDAFQAHQANFSAMSSSSLFLGLLEQYTYIKVDEQGTESAAVTVGGMYETALPPSSSTLIPFYMNRPFAFVIKEKSTGVILFMGKVTQL